MISYKDIQPYIEKKLVSEQVHPEDPNVRIFNYTQSCQFSQAWDDITRQCRGLIMDVSTDEILARPFPKFFNYQEHVAKGWPIPEGTPIISEKLDGSLGIMYTLNGKPWIATRGSFTSDQAIWATRWWRENVGLCPATGLTDLFEIIYPENRIVVNYDFSGLVYLTTINVETGLAQPCEQWGWTKVAKTIPANSIDELLKLDEPNSEGFVLYYPNDNVRMKIKFPEYVRLHKLVTGLSEISIWEHLREGKSITDLIDNVPDEFFLWVKRVSERLLDSYDSIADECEKIFESVRLLPTRKDQAKEIQYLTGKYNGIIFALLDKQGSKASDQIWRMIRPRGTSAFKKDIDL